MDMQSTYGKLQEIYYKPNHLWTGNKAIKNLKQFTNLSPKLINLWLSKQAFYHVHLPALKIINRPH